MRLGDRLWPFLSEIPQRKSLPLTRPAGLAALLGVGISLMGGVALLRVALCWGGRGDHGAAYWCAGLDTRSSKKREKQNPLAPHRITSLVLVFVPGLSERLPPVYRQSGNKRPSCRRDQSMSFDRCA